MLWKWSFVRISWTPIMYRTFSSAFWNISIMLQCKAVSVCQNITQSEGSKVEFPVLENQDKFSLSSITNFCQSMNKRRLPNKMKPKSLRRKKKWKKYRLNENGEDRFQSPVLDFKTHIFWPSEWKWTKFYLSKCWVNHLEQFLEQQRKFSRMRGAKNWSLNETFSDSDSSW